MAVQYLNPPGLLHSPAFSQAVVVEQPARTVYVGARTAWTPRARLSVTWPSRPPEPWTTPGPRWPLRAGT